MIVSRSIRRAVAIVVVGAACMPSGHDGRAPLNANDSTGYRVVHGWPALAEGTFFGGVSAVGVDSRGDVFIAERLDREWPKTDILDTTPMHTGPIVSLDGRTGAVRARWGANILAFPHGLTIDSLDNVWITDVALHQVFKFSHDGQLLLTVGTRAKPGNDATHFNRPTDVAIAPDGSFFVSDGYENTRIVKFAADGKFVSQWGTKGTGEGQFDLPHGITLNTDGLLYVSDRGNKRVQVFDQSGRFVKQWSGAAFVSPNSIAVAPDGTLLLTDGGGRDSIPDRSGVVVLRADGTRIGKIGRWGNQDGQFFDLHDVAVARDGSVYAVDVSGRRVQKFTGLPRSTK